ncbi:hypothetical protein BH09ACT10_BH09ACT10_27490 [soil metagenome]
MTAQTSRTYVDRCPGVFRPWIADDGALIRLRLIGGALGSDTLRRISVAASEFGDGNVHVTSRANLQLRAIPAVDGCVPQDLVDQISAAGLLPSPSHELVRNVNVSPLTGRSGGRADLRPIAAELDRLLCADPRFAALSGRFLFALDDGSGDISGRNIDLGLFALDGETAQLRIGSQHWGPIVRLDDAPAALVALAGAFVAARGTGEQALWHIDELPRGGAELLEASGEPPARDDRTQVTSTPPPIGEIRQDDGLTALHIDIPEGVLTPAIAHHLLALPTDTFVVTPWRSIVATDLEHV